MSTRAERKALIGLGIVAVLGGGVRLWRQHHPPVPAGNQEWSSTEVDPDDDQPPSYDRDKSQKGGWHKKGRSNKRSFSAPPVDSTSIIDLDQASLEQIEALGVLKANGARLIIANRDSFGPFGSITEVERIPYLTHSEIRKLARRVTFSAIPRPTNTILPGRPTPPQTGHRTRLPPTSP